MAESYSQETFLSRWMALNENAIWSQNKPLQTYMYNSWIKDDQFKVWLFATQQNNSFSSGICHRIWVGLQRFRSELNN